MIESLVELARTVADPNRLRLLTLLAEADREVCVCELMEILDLPQSRVSRHLQVLRRAGLVRDRRADRRRFRRARDRGRFEPCGDGRKRLVVEQDDALESAR